MVIYVPSVYINLSAAALAGLFQPGCLLRRLGDFSCLWDPKRGPGCAPANNNGSATGTPDRGDTRTVGTPDHGDTRTAGTLGPCPAAPAPRHCLQAPSSSPSVLAGSAPLLLQQLKWLFIICSSPGAPFPPLLPCPRGSKQAAFSCRRQILLSGLHILVAFYPFALSGRDVNTQVRYYQQQDHSLPEEMSARHGGTISAFLWALLFPIPQGIPSHPWNSFLCHPRVRN